MSLENIFFQIKLHDKNTDLVVLYIMLYKFHICCNFTFLTAVIIEWLLMSLRIK